MRTIRPKLVFFKIFKIQFFVALYEVIEDILPFVLKTKQFWGFSEKFRNWIFQKIMKFFTKYLNTLAVNCYTYSLTWISIYISLWIRSVTEENYENYIQGRVKVLKCTLTALYVEVWEGSTTFILICLFLRIKGGLIAKLSL